MRKQDLQQIIEDLNQLVNNSKDGYVNECDILKAIRNDEFKTSMLSVLIRNNMPYALCRLSEEAVSLAYRIYMLEDYVDSEEKYLDKTLLTLNGFKSELPRILEYVNLLKQANALDASRERYRETILDGVRMYDYKCSLDNIKF